MKKLSYLIILGAIVTACNCTHPKTSIQEKIEIIMANDTCINDTSAFRWLEDDSTHTFCVASSDRTILGIGYNAYDKDIVADSLCCANRKGCMVPFVWKRENRKRKAIPGN